MMKKNKNKRKNSIRVQDKREGKKDIRSSLVYNMLFVIGVSLVCYLLLSPLSEWLSNTAYTMSVDVEQKGGFAHMACEIGAQVIFYLSSFLMTATFFVGAAYIVRFAQTKAPSRMLTSASILILGMSSSNIIQLCVYAIVRMRTPYTYLADPYGMLFNECVIVGSALLITLAAFLISRTKASGAVYSGVCALGMFLISTGIELYDNIPFFIKGIILREDVVKMIISLVLYMLHAILGFIIMWLFLTKKEEK